MTSPLRAYIATGKRFYTSEWLAWAWRGYGGEVVSDEAQADVVLVTVQDVDDLPMLAATWRRLVALPRRPVVVAGGLQAWTGNGVALAYSDAAVVGEGEEFIEAACGRGLDDALSLPCVCTRSDPWKPVVPSRRIALDRAPVVQVNRGGYYALAGRGCHNKCAFCATSWSTPQVNISARRAQSILSRVEALPGKPALTFITNDSAMIPLETRVAQSMTAADYLRRADAVRAPLIRLGIEGLTEARRKWFGKPFADDDLRCVLDTAHTRRQPLHLFFIVGLGGDAEAVEQYAANVLPLSEEKSPAIWHKWTMFQPTPFTPLWTFDCRTLEEFDHEHAFRTCAGRCRRYRDFAASAVSSAMYRAIMSRVLWEHANLVPARNARMSGAAYAAEVERRGLSYALAPTPKDLIAGAHVMMETASARDALAARLGMPPLRRPQKPGE